MNKFILAALCLLVIAVWCEEEEEERNRRFNYYCTTLILGHCFIHHPKDPQCGTNNYTYYNKCEFSKDHCRNDRIHLAHSGECNADSHLQNHTHGADIVFQLMCQSLTTCPDEFQEVCASDGKTYMNECEYEMKRCMHPDLHIVFKGPCAHPIGV